MKQYQKIYTENMSTVGLTEYPGALIINKRFSNIPPGAPIFMFNWAEDTIIRERVFVAADKQRRLRAASPSSFPASPGDKGPIELSYLPLRRPAALRRGRDEWSAARPPETARRSNGRCCDSCSCASHRRSRFCSS